MRLPSLISATSFLPMQRASLRRVLLLHLFILGFLGVGIVTHAQPPVSTLSPAAKFSVLTCSPGTELYSVFGHSALRIQDSTSRLDWVWNYGVFEFDTPNFLMKFARGKLLYYVLSYSYRHFQAEYTAERRSITEQTLNLSEGQKKAIFDALLVNELPDNKYYKYDFFYDNCATRERDIIAKALGPDLRWHPKEGDDYGTYRELIDGYLRNEVWADFGIDLALGRPTDKTADQQGSMFLPDYLLQALSTAEVKIDGQWKPLVASQQVLLEMPKNEVTAFQYGPHLLGWIIFALTAAVTFLGFRGRKPYRGFDFLLFFILGLLGVLLLLFWIGTDHQATYWNLNMLWASPLHLIYAFLLAIRLTRGIALKYAMAMIPVTLSAFFLHCGLHAAFYPLILAVLLRLGWTVYIHRKAKV